MQKARPGKKNRPVLALDADRLGLIAAVVVATVVMAIGFFVRQAGTFEVIWRAGLAFVGTYAATFCLVRIILRCVLTEFAEQKQTRRRERAERLRERQRGRGETAVDRGPGTASGEGE